MPVDPITIALGTATTVALQTPSRAGPFYTTADPSGFSGAEPLAANLRAANATAVVATPAASWVDAASVKFLINFVDADTAALAPGDYRLEVKALTAAGRTDELFLGDVSLVDPAGDPTSNHLITLAELVNADRKTFGRLPAEEQLGLIDGASRLIESECDFRLRRNTYTEVHRPGRTRKLYLRQGPVTAIARVATDYGTIATIQHLDGTATRAQVGYAADASDEDDLKPTGLSLTTVSGGVPGAVLNFPFATYRSVQSLLDAVSASGPWAVSAVGGAYQTSFATWATADLSYDVGMMGASVLAVELKGYVRDLAYACDGDLARQRTVEIFEGRPDGYEYPQRRYGASGAGYSGLAGVVGGLDPRVGAVLVNYTAGRSMGTVPGDLKRLTVAAAKWLRDLSLVSGLLRSETIGRYSYTAGPADAGLPGWLKDGCYKYKRKDIY